MAIFIALAALSNKKVFRYGMMALLPAHRQETWSQASRFGESGCGRLGGISPSRCGTGE